MEEETIEETIISSIDPKTVNKEAWQTLNQMFSHLSNLVNFKYHFLIYKLLKRGHAEMSHLVQDTGLSRERLYKIVEAFEKQFS